MPSAPSARYVTALELRLEPAGAARIPRARPRRDCIDAHANLAHVREAKRTARRRRPVAPALHAHLHAGLAQAAPGTAMPPAGFHSVRGPCSQPRCAEHEAAFVEGLQQHAVVPIPAIDVSGRHVTPAHFVGLGLFEQRGEGVGSMQGRSWFRFGQHGMHCATYRPLCTAAANGRTTTGFEEPHNGHCQAPMTGIAHPATLFTPCQRMSYHQVNAEIFSPVSNITSPLRNAEFAGQPCRRRYGGADPDCWL